MWTQIAYLSVVLATTTPDLELCTPAVDEVVDRALEVAGFVGAPSLSRRARLAPLLPNSVRLELRAAEDDLLRDSYDVDQDFDELLAPDGIDLSDTRQIGIDHVREARVVVYWQLDSLVWSNEMLAAMRYEDARDRDAWAMTEEIIALYFDVDFERRYPGLEPRRGALERHRAVALLNERTDGWFSRASRCEEFPANPP